MTDLERDLREMMHQKAEDGHSVPRRTSQLARRARVNRAATVLVGAMAIVALLVGGFGAARSLSRNQTLPPAKLIPEQEGPKGDWIAYSTAHAGDELLRPRCSGFASGCERPLEGSDIFLVHEGQERQEPRLVAGRGEDGEKWNMCPAFSPDGTMLAFGTKSPAGPGLRVVGVSRTGEITSPNIDLEVPGEGRAPCPRWSSDGSRLVYLHRGTVIVRALDGSSPPAAQGDPVVADFRRGRALIRGVVSPSGELIARTRH